MTRPKVITADTCFDTKYIRESNSKRGIKSVIPINPRNKKKNNVGRPIKFDKEIYKKRSVTRPGTVTADAGREHNLRRDIKSVIPVNPRNRKKNRIGRQIKYDKEL